MKRHHQSAISSLIKRRGQLSTTAIVFMILGICFLVGIVLLAVVLALAIPAIRQAQTTARAAAVRVQSKNNLKQIGLAFHNYHDTHNMLPPGGIYTTDKVPYNSWMTSLLPYVNYASTYNQIDFSQPWTAAQNQTAFQTQVLIYIHPGAPPGSGSIGKLGAAHYAGNSQLLLDNQGTKFQNVTDGLSNVIMAGEVAGSFMAWGDPGNRRDPTAGIGNGPDQFGSPERGATGMDILLGDGSVRSISYSINPNVLSGLADPDDGQVIPEF
ncbi:MAG: DUF1559 domain-containing protein [Planctomyces sp.]|nr:DUF1559 domain-containing protein [Planctomyces sp.]